MAGTRDFLSYSSEGQMPEMKIWPIPPGVEDGGHICSRVSAEAMVQEINGRRRRQRKQRAERDCVYTDESRTVGLSKCGSLHVHVCEDVRGCGP